MGARTCCCHCLLWFRLAGSRRMSMLDVEARQYFLFILFDVFACDLILVLILTFDIDVGWLLMLMLVLS